MTARFFFGEQKNAACGPAFRSAGLLTILQLQSRQKTSTSPTFSTNMSGTAATTTVAAGGTFSVGADGTPNLDFDCTNWQSTDFETKLHIGEPAKVGNHIAIAPVETLFVGPDGTETAAPEIVTGEMRVPFEFSTTDRQGNPQSLAEISASWDDKPTAAADFVEKFDKHLVNWVVETNPDTSKGGKYFKNPPTHSTAVEKVRTTLYTNTARLNSETGLPYPPTATFRMWTNGADMLFVDTDGITPIPASKALARGNRVVFKIRLDGIVLAEVSIIPRWTIVGGIVTKYSEYSGGKASAHYAGGWSSYATTTPAVGPMPVAPPSNGIKEQSLGQSGFVGAGGVF